MQYQWPNFPQNTNMPCAISFACLVSHLLPPLWDVGCVMCRAKWRVYQHIVVQLLAIFSRLYQWNPCKVNLNILTYFHHQQNWLILGDVHMQSTSQKEIVSVFWFCLVYKADDLTWALNWSSWIMFLQKSQLSGLILSAKTTSLKGKACVK